MNLLALIQPQASTLQIVIVAICFIAAFAGLVYNVRKFFEEE